MNQKMIIVEVEHLNNLLKDALKEHFNASIYPILSKHYVPDQILDVQGVADLLKQSKKTIYKKVSNNEIPYIKTGKNLLFNRQHILDWLEDKTVYNKEAKAKMLKDLGIIRNHGNK